MKILLINGSPKGERSNTLKLSNAFIDGIRENYHESTYSSPLIVERINVKTLNIMPCLGCFACWKDTPGKCCIKDDMQNVLEKILWADLVIWSFPLYYFSLPGKLKTLIDRQLPLNLPFMDGDTEGGGHPSRYDMTGKKTVLISTCGFYTAKGNYNSVIAQFDRMCGKGYQSIFCAQGELFRVDELKKRTDEYLDLVKVAGREFLSGGISKSTLNKLEEPLYPKDVFEAMADTSWGIDEKGEKMDETLIFTKQMANLYNPSSYTGKDIVLEMDYTDVNRRYFILLTKSGSQVLEDFDGNVTTTVHTPYSVWLDIATNKIDGPTALFKRMYTVDGDFSLMMNWDKFFDDNTAVDKSDANFDNTHYDDSNLSDNFSTKTAKTSGNVFENNALDEKTSNTASAKNNAKKTNMLCLLLGWMIFWIAPSIDLKWGSFLSVFTCCLIPLLFSNYKLIFYDKLSFALVGALSVSLLLGAPIIYIMPLSYFIFGIIWTVSAFFKIPLTAHYSLNNYGGDKALLNPLFVRTNRILTIAWGVLYLLTPIWSYFIMLSSASSFLGLINSALPIFMGIFTVWFQKWYPAKFAKG